MARKDVVPRTHGFNDVIGVVLGAAALLLLVALFSFDPHDCSANQVPPNSPVHNLGGPIGAYTGLAIFNVFGLAGFVLPILMIIFGLGYLFSYMAYLQHRRTWGAVLLVCTMGFLTLFEHDLSILRNAATGVSAPSPGGYIGIFLNFTVLHWLGKVGASIVLGTTYVVGVMYMTNFQLGQWCRQWWAERTGKPVATTPEERELEKRARELERQAKKLQEQLDKRKPVVAAEKDEPIGLGADLKPVPEPTIRDLSIPTSKAKKPKADPKHVVEPEPAEEGEVISAKEITAATTADILGDKAELSKKVAEVTKESAADASKDEPKSDMPDKMKAPEVPPPVITINTSKPKPKKPKPIAVASTPKIGNYQLPSLDLLQYPDMTVRPTESKEELIANAKLMQQTLAQFEIEVAIGDITKGPTITRYELHPAPGVKLEKITALNNNIAAALKAERINVLAPVPGKSSVGVEVPNAVKTKVILRDLFESEEWRNTKARIPLALGKDVYGHPIVADLAEMPHVLIAGSTGSGKSVCISSVIASLLYKFSPDQLRFVMIDPKVVELQQYNKLPHLVVPVVTDPKKVILALRWVVNEMEKRYQIFAKVGVRNIHSFNERPRTQAPPPEPEKPKKEKAPELDSDGFAVELDEEIVVPREDDIVIPDHLSYIVVIIDELADLMLVAPADVEMAIARITQMARAAGIHCIVATQRPSVDVITGVIKANIPARIAFQVASKVDSRTILDTMGADKLLGKGDMLFLPPGSAKLIRAQGALVTDQEIHQIVEHIAGQGKPSYELEIHQQLQKASGGLNGDENSSGEDEELIQQCIEVIRSEQKASVSLMQRRLRLGYTRAARIMDDLEARGIVGPSKGAEPRDILIDLDAEQPGAEEPSGAGVGK